MKRTTEIERPAEANQSIRRASITAGVGLLVMSALSAFGYLVAVKAQVTQGDAARTAKHIMDHEGLFRLGILSLFLVTALDVVVALALYRLFRPVSEGISMLAAWLRIVYAGVFLVAISQLVGALRLIGDAGYFGVFSTAQVHAQALLQINTFKDTWDAGLVLFGLNLLVVAYLAYRSGYVPRLLGALLAIAGVGYVFDSFGRVLSRGSSSDVSAITGIGEFVFALWLVIWGRRITLSDSARLAS
jgi:hypothetical protein